MRLYHFPRLPFEDCRLISTGPLNFGHWFDMLAQSAARAMGHALTFAIALQSIVLWGISGPFLGYSDSWQLIINTSTTICTFLMVILIQHTQNRDSAAVHLKLNELLRAVDHAQNSLIALEDMDEDDLKRLQEQYRTLSRRPQLENAEVTPSAATDAADHTGAVSGSAPEL